jgi:hypothetical protein
MLSCPQSLGYALHFHKTLHIFIYLPSFTIKINLHLIILNRRMRKVPSLERCYGPIIEHVFINPANSNSKNSFSENVVTYFNCCQVSDVKDPREIIIGLCGDWTTIWTCEK